MNFQQCKAGVGFAVVVFLFAAKPLVAQNATDIRLPPEEWVAPIRFTNITSVRELENGVLVADATEEKLVLLTWGGREISIGRRGRGPGEYQGVGQLYALAGDSTLFIDSFSGRWNLFDGSRIADIVGEGERLTRLLRERFSGADAFGNVLSRSGFHYSSRSSLRGAPDSLLLLMGNRLTQQIDTLLHLKGPGGAGAVVLPAAHGQLAALVGNNPLAYEDQALLFLDGWIAVAYAQPYRVDWRSPRGTWKRGAALPFAPERVGRAEKCAMFAIWFGDARPCEPSLLPAWPEFLPPFRSEPGDRVVFAAPRGNLVIERLTFAPSPKRYDLVNRENLLVGVLEVPRDVALVGFGPDSIYTVQTGAFDLQTLRRHRWP